MKRFYEKVVVVAEAGGATIRLDGRPVRTPARALLVLPDRALAEAVAGEWRAQADTVDPRSMPLMRIAATAIDRVAPRLEAVIDEIAAYADSDLVCYRAEGPPELVARQHEAWQPLLNWLAGRYGARLAVTVGVVHRPQSKAKLAALRKAVAGHDAMALAALHLATGAAGSLVVALALAAGEIAADEAFALSQLDESFQIERWGEDAEARARRQALAADIDSAGRFLKLCQAPPV